MDKCKCSALVYLHACTRCVTRPTTIILSVVTARQAGGEAWPPTTISWYHCETTHDIVIQKNSHDSSPRSEWKLLKHLEVISGCKILSWLAKRYGYSNRYILPVCHCFRDDAFLISIWFVSYCVAVSRKANKSVQACVYLMIVGAVIAARYFCVLFAAGRTQLCACSCLSVTDTKH